MNIIEITNSYIRERALSDAAAIHYGYVAELFVRDAGVQDVREITREALLNWREETLSRNVSSSTWNNYFRHLRVLLRFAADHEPVPALSGNLSALLLREHVERPKTISRSDLKKAMAYISSRRSAIRPRWFWAILLRTLYYTGMRRRQLIDLMWSDVDLKNAKIQLRATSSKNRHGWEIPIVALLLPSLFQLRERTLKELGKDADIGSRYVFDISLFTEQYRSCSNGKMNARSISNFFSRLRFATGVSISAHRLRHTMATELAQLGLYKELQSLLGHTDMKMTMRYVHPELENLRLMAEHLESIDD